MKLRERVINLDLKVFPTWQMVEKNELRGSYAVVIDVLRATNTIITALANGAKEIIPVPEIEIAWEMKKENPSYLLGGERGAQKISGFDLGNSPLEYSPEVVFNRGIIFTTSNGSRALNSSSKADMVCVASLANSKALAKFLANSLKNLTIVCAGTLGNPSLEDTLAAGKIIEEILALEKNYHLNDFGYISLSTYLQNKANIFQAISSSPNGQKLKKLNMSEDIEYCSLMDQTEIIPIFKDGNISNYPRIL